MRDDPVPTLGKLAARLKRAAVENALRNNLGHIAPSLSCAELLVALYYRVMTPDQDRFILSKAHGCYVYYEILCDLGRMPLAAWRDISQGTGLKGCVERKPEWGLEASCGALGHGLPMAVGLAWGLRRRGAAGRVYCLVGDGELQEGSNWEAMTLAARLRLDNLILLVDGNGLQAMDFLQNIMTGPDPAGELSAKIAAFGFDTHRCGGHDFADLLAAFDRAHSGPPGVPRAIYADTVKGYGLKAIENLPRFHYRIPDADELAEGWRDD